MCIYKHERNEYMVARKRSGYLHLYPWTQEEPGASIVAHPARLVGLAEAHLDSNSQQYYPRHNDAAVRARACRAVDVAAVLSSSVSRALCAGASNFQRDLRQDRPPPAIHFAERHRRNLRRRDRIARARLLAHCAQPVLRDDVAGCIPRRRLV